MSEDTSTEDVAASVDEPRSYTQAEVDRIVSERVNKSKAQFKDYGELKDKAQRLDEIEQASKSEADKLRTQLEKAAEQTKLLAAEREELIRGVQEERVKNAVIVEATKANVVNPEAAYKLLDKSKVSFTDTGEVQGVSRALQDLLKENSYLLNRSAPAGFGGGVQGAVSNTSSREEFNDRLRKEAGFG